jgi:ATPase family associated with various cellular activities (AAA)
MNAELRTILSGLDTLIRREILRLRARHQLSLDEFRGLYIGDEQVDALVRETAADAVDLAAGDSATWREAVAAAGIRDARLMRLTGIGLSALELAVLLIALAPGLEAKYETLYAYLNNDVTRKLPTLELVHALICTNDEERLDVRRALGPQSQLITTGLVRLHPHRDGVPGAAGQIMFSANAGLANYLLGLPFRDEQIAEAFSLRRPRGVHAALPERLRTEVAQRMRCATGPEPARVVLLEPSSTLSATVFATALCGPSPLAVLDLRHVARDALHNSILGAMLFARLNESALLVEGVESLLNSNERLAPEASALRLLLRMEGPPVLINATEHLASIFAATERVRIALPMLEPEQRHAIWNAALQGHGVATDGRDLGDIAVRFRLGIEAVEAAAQTLADGGSHATREALFAAARSQSDTQLARLAQRVPQRHEWNDLVLPAETRERVRSLIDAVAARDRVLGKWGFGKALGNEGLRALFAGPSGTGKTMTVGVVARELGLDAYRIDLSQIVSKYIGETEKNLERIFQGAAGANAILFFDEADALFGKRSEVKDAHDRYANIEVAYLLQRIEDFDGVAILATNISRNIDAAFSRRMHFVIEFPRPGPAERERLWRGIFPKTAPLASDLDYEFLGRRFDLSGGDIRNVALDAAFLAAGYEGRISMRHVVQATARELVKQGRSPSATDFRQHFALLDSAGERADVVARRAGAEAKET